MPGFMAQVLERLERLEASSSRAPDSGLASAVSEVASFSLADGRTGRARTALDSGSSVKSQLRSRKTNTPFPPRRGSRLSPEADAASSVGDGDDAEGARVTEAPGDGRIAEEVVSRMRANHRSALDYVWSLNFSNQRAGHEARRTAQALDALMREGVPLHLEGMEILVRNLAGVCEADKRGDPTVLEGLEWALPQDIVPRSVLRTVLKDAKRRNELKPKNKPAPRPNDKGKQGAGKQ